MAEPMPALIQERATCPLCGAATLEEAGTRCQQGSDETGEYYCKGGMDEDAEGFLTRPTAASIKALDDWCDREMQEEPS